jgi:hypothetical protein
MLERVSLFHNSGVFITDMNVLQHSNFCADRLLAGECPLNGIPRLPTSFQNFEMEPMNLNAQSKERKLGQGQPFHPSGFGTATNTSTLVPRPGSASMENSP